MRELLLEFDRSKGRRIGLENALRDAIVFGRLKPGTKLPSTRALAEDTGLARATVVAAYEHLVVEGYLTARQGAGTTVADVHELNGSASSSSSPSPFTKKSRRIDLRPGEPDSGMFPRSAWLKSVQHALADVPDEALGYGDARGSTRLREVLASYMGRSRGVVTTPDLVSIFGGTTSAMGFVGEMFREVGIERVAMEDPGHVLTRQVLALSGVTPVPVEMDSSGIAISSLQAANVGAVVVTPAHQFPLGMTMSGERRAELVEWAMQTGAWIVEDDYDGEFRYDRQPISALQPIAPDRVIYAGTSSKMLSPALRLSWLAIPPQLSRPLASVKHFRAAVSTIEQLAFADFVDRGELDRHLTSARAVYLRRQRVVVDTISANAPWLEATRSPAGLHLTALGNIDLDESALVAAATQYGIEMIGLAPFWQDEPTKTGLVLGYSRPAQHEFGSAVERFASFLTNHHHGH